MKIHEIKAIHEEPYFRKMKVESGFLYNFYDTEKDEYQKEWIFVPELSELQTSTKLDKQPDSKALHIADVSKRFSDEKFVTNVCLSYRHDFGLLPKEEKEKLIFECKEWMRAITNNLPYS